MFKTFTNGFFGESLSIFIVRHRAAFLFDDTFIFRARPSVAHPTLTLRSAANIFTSVLDFYRWELANQILCPQSLVRRPRRLRGTGGSGDENASAPQACQANAKRMPSLPSLTDPVPGPARPYVRAKSRETRAAPKIFRLVDIAPS